MIEIAYVIGLGILASILIYFAFKLQKDHFILQLISVIFALLFLMAIPWALVGAQTECELVLNSTTNETYTYDKQCYTKDSELPSTTLWVYFGFFFIFFAYLSVMLVKSVVDRMKLKEGRT